MTIEHLTYFVALAEHRNYRLASQECNISQPALSQAIRKLELSLGCDLINRTQKPLSLTKKGVTFYKRIKSILDDYDELLVDISTFHRDETKIRIGILPTLSPYLLPLFLGSYIDANPLLKVQVLDLTTDDIIKKIKNDEIDVGILALPLAEKNIVQEEIFYEEFLAYTKDPIHKNFISLMDVDLSELWILDEGHCFRDQVIQLFGLSASDYKRVDYQPNDVEALFNLVDYYKGVTIVPELATLNMKHGENKRLYPFEEPVPVRQIGIAYHKYNINRGEINSIKQTIYDNLPQYFKSRNKDRRVLGMA